MTVDEKQRGDAPDGLVTVETAARFLAVSRTAVYGLIACGALLSVKIGRSRRISRAELHDFVLRHTGSGRSPS